VLPCLKWEANQARQSVNDFAAFCFTDAAGRPLYQAPLYLELQAFLDDAEPGQRVRAIPGQGTKVPLWILGSSLYGAQLAAALGLRSTTRFLEEKGQLIGLKARTFISRDELVRKLEKSLGGKVKAFAFGPKKIKTIGIITGGAGSEIYRVAEEKIDTFITGEAPHWAAVAAEELGINLLLGGHYATETFGLKALAAHLAMRFKFSCAFIHCPTGI